MNRRMDTFFNGRIRVLQDRQGYRFSIDAVILAHHAGPRPGRPWWISAPAAASSP